MISKSQGAQRKEPGALGIIYAGRYTQAAKAGIMIDLHEHRCHWATMFTEPNPTCTRTPNPWRPVPSQRETLHP